MRAHIYVSFLSPRLAILAVLHFSRPKDSLPSIYVARRSLHHRDTLQARMRLRLIKVCDIIENCISLRGG